MPLLQEKMGVEQQAVFYSHDSTSQKSMDICKRLHVSGKPLRNCFKHSSQIQRIQQAKLLQYLKIQFLNYSSRLAIISLPQSMPNSVALVYMAPLWIRARTEGDILTGLPLLYPLNMDISHASVQHKPLCNCTDSNKREGAVQT